MSRGNLGGYAQFAQEEDRIASTLAELEGGIRTLLGGRAAEILYYGPREGLDTGAVQDLERATSAAKHIVCRFGMDEEFGPLVAPELMESAEGVASPLYMQVHQAASKILREQMRETLRLLDEHRPQLEALVAHLVEHERISRDELEKLWEKRPS